MALADREIRKREIGHGISHGVRRVRAEDVSAHPGYVCHLGAWGRGGMSSK
jgi:hypothetical protein